jgi:hypothetical protein
VNNAKFVFLAAPDKEVGLRREKDEKKQEEAQKAIEEVVERVVWNDYKLVNKC